MPKSIDLNTDHPASWLFLALTHWQLDEKDQARKWYDKSTEWKQKNTPDAELKTFYSEAEKLLGNQVENSEKLPRLKAPSLSRDVTPRPESIYGGFAGCLTPHEFLTQLLGLRFSSALNRAPWQCLLVLLQDRRAVGHLVRARPSFSFFHTKTLAE